MTCTNRGLPRSRRLELVARNLEFRLLETVGGENEHFFARRLHGYSPDMRCPAPWWANGHCRETFLRNSPSGEAVPRRGGSCRLRAPWGRAVMSKKLSVAVTLVLSIIIGASAARAAEIKLLTTGAFKPEVLD